MRRPVIAANWKMHMTIGETRELAGKLLAAKGREADIVVCPPFTGLTEALTVLRGSGLLVGGQDMHWEEKGAFTGEISPAMLKDLGCTHVILGHSERRQLFGETDDAVNKKVKAALHHGLIPIFCLGETLAQREQGTTEQVCARQLELGLAGLKAQDVAAIIIAYEPVWAIGTGRTASPDDAQRATAFIRARLASQHGQAASQVRILYGGSVKPENIADLMAEPDIDGALVGGASLDAGSFLAIIDGGIKS